MKKFSYSQSFIYSIFMHVAILLFLIIDLGFNHAMDSTPKVAVKQKKMPSIQAYSVKAEDLESEMNQILKERETAERIKAEKTARYEKKLKRLQNEAQRQKQHLSRLKNENKTLEIAKAKKLQEQKNALIAAQKEQEALKKRLQATEKKLKAKKLALEKARDEDKQRELERHKAKEKALKLAKEKEMRAKIRAEEAAQLQKEVDKYKALIITSISQNWIVPESADLSLSCKFQILLSTTGEVLSVSLIKSSGDKRLDRSAQLAIYKASPLPVPSDTKAFEIFKILNLTVKPEDLKKVI